MDEMLKTKHVYCLADTFYLLNYSSCEIGTLFKQNSFGHFKLCEKFGKGLDNDLGYLPQGNRFWKPCGCTHDCSLEIVPDFVFGIGPKQSTINETNYHSAKWFIKCWHRSQQRGFNLLIWFTHHLTHMTYFTSSATLLISFGQ